MISGSHPAASRLVRIVVAFLLPSLLLTAGGPGFRSQKQFRERYAKHGREFGDVTPERYLALAQQLRDAPKGGDILEAVRADGSITRFDRRRGYFGAYNADRTIRTFFIPNQGESYFRRQINSPHE